MLIRVVAQRVQPFTPTLGLDRVLRLPVGALRGTASSGFLTCCCGCGTHASLPRPVVRGWSCPKCMQALSFR